MLGLLAIADGTNRLSHNMSNQQPTQSNIQDEWGGPQELIC